MRSLAEMRKSVPIRLLLVIALSASLAGCSVKKFAINKLGDSLANAGTTYSADNDPELIRDALPFSMKLIESLLAESPKHRGLLFAASSGFTQYAYVFVQQSAEELESSDFKRSTELRVRARNMYLRARDYGIRGLEVKHPGFGAALRRDPKAAVKAANIADVPLLFWTAASWGAAISVAKDKPELIADQLIVEALIDRAQQLQPDFDNGAIHGFLISYESARQGVKGDFAPRSREHFEQAVRLTAGQLASPYVSLAETVSVQKQDRAEFTVLLNKALAVDPDQRPEFRLANLVMQRRARWLLSRADDLFIGGENSETSQLMVVPNAW